MAQGVERSNWLVAGVGVAVVAALAAAVIIGWPSGRRNSADSAGRSDSVRPSGSPASLDPVDSDVRAGFAEAARLAAAAPGFVTVEVRDRRTGEVWRAGDPRQRIWAGSTPKLALAVALLEGHRSGQLRLDAAARRHIDAMLSVSDNAAADALWDRYIDSAAWMSKINIRYAMADAGYVSGFPRRWGFIKCTSHDLANLISYILGTLHPADRRYLVAAMRHVAPVQRWGVWAAGQRNLPGVKNGWSVESDDGRDHWITATAGFAGPGERYIVAAMYHQPPGGDSIDRGVHILTDIVATIFGEPTPAPAEIPIDY